MTKKELLQWILKQFKEPKPGMSLSLLVELYLSRYGCWLEWFKEPESNLREDDFHAAGFRLEKVLSFDWKCHKVFLTEGRILAAILRCG